LLFGNLLKGFPGFFEFTVLDLELLVKIYLSSLGEFYSELKEDVFFSEIMLVVLQKGCISLEKP